MSAGFLFKHASGFAATKVATETYRLHIRRWAINWGLSGAPLGRYLYDGRAASSAASAAAPSFLTGGNLLTRRQFSVTGPGYMSRKIVSLKQINSIRKTNGNFDSRNSCKRLGTSRLHELHESKLPFDSRIEHIRSKLSNFSAHVSGATAPAGWRAVIQVACVLLWVSGQGP